jgi:hypothetical protein
MEVEGSEFAIFQARLRQPPRGRCCDRGAALLVRSGRYAHRGQVETVKDPCPTSPRMDRDDQEGRIVSGERQAKQAKRRQTGEQTEKRIEDGRG